MTYIGLNMSALLDAMLFLICSLLTELLQFSISRSNSAISSARAFVLWSVRGLEDSRIGPDTGGG